MKSLEKHYIFAVFAVSVPADVSITRPDFKGYVKPDLQIYFKGRLKTSVMTETEFFCLCVWLIFFLNNKIEKRNCLDLKWLLELNVGVSNVN